MALPLTAQAQQTPPPVDATADVDASAAGGRSLLLTSPAGEGITFVDVNDDGQGVGDYLIFNHPVYQRGREAGTLRGLCTLVEEALCEGDVTFDLRRGLITVEGPFDFTSAANTFAVTGGTGDYQGVGGTLRTRSSSDETIFTFRLVR